LTELQYDPILRNSFNREALITVYVSLPVSRFCELRKLMAKFDKLIWQHIHM